MTPINAEILNKLLKESNYDMKETEFLIEGFTQGFNIGYQGSEKRQSKANNLPLRVGSQTELWNKVIKEVKLGRVAGPYKEVPFDNYIQSPIGLVPKDGNSGKTRLIFHLSYDFGEEEDKKSLNHHTPDEICSVKYHDLDDAVQSCLDVCKVKSQNDSEQGKKNIVFQDNIECEDYDDTNDNDDEDSIFMGKTDVQSAFHLVPLSVWSWAWLVMFAIHPRTKEKLFFIDKCLPFGASISCSIFQRFSNALKYLAQIRTQN